MRVCVPYSGSSPTSSSCFSTFSRVSGLTYMPCIAAIFSSTTFTSLSQSLPSFSSLLSGTYTLASSDLPAHLSWYSYSFCLFCRRRPVSFSTTPFTLYILPSSSLSSKVTSFFIVSSSSSVSDMVAFLMASLSSPGTSYRQRMYSLGVLLRWFSIRWKACWATYATRTAGCFHTLPICGMFSPMSSLIIVDLPAPLGPRMATRLESETCTVMSSTVGLVFLGYVHAHFSIFMSALPLDLTPSM
mmetsp:Transcript_147/g.377  ORF Transcript_147/g.377 Transcript_147/m.377 type:complete len:243 (-) Transcript_147:66-794(-)